MVHHNILSVMHLCGEDESKPPMVVYPYMNRGNLKNYLRLSRTVETLAKVEIRFKTFCLCDIDESRYLKKVSFIMKIKFCLLTLDEKRCLKMIYHENKVLFVDFAKPAREVAEYVSFSSYFKFRQVWTYEVFQIKV